MPEPLSPARRLLYALGNPGQQLTDRVVVLIAVYFYLPPPGRGLEAQVPEQVWLGFITVYGVATLVGRLFDTAADPIVAHISDRSRSPLGRRRSLLIWGVGPMVAIPVLLFFPPFGAGSPANGVWLGGLSALYYVAFTVYVAPYLAMLPEIAWTEHDRVRLAQWMSFAAIPALALATAWGVGLDLFRAAGLSTTAAVRAVVVAFSAAALLLCLGPILGVDEGRHSRGTRSDFPFRVALLATLRNRTYLIYLLAQIFFVMGVTLFQPLLPYVATVILGRSEGFTLWLTLMTGLGLVLGFGIQRSLVSRLGPKRVMMLCLACMTVALASLAWLRADVPGGPGDARNLAVCCVAFVLFGVPAAGFLVLPYVLISQLIDADEARTGSSRAAMFFGVQGLLTKWVYGLSIWLFTWLLARFGNSPAEPWGVILVGPVAGALAAVSLLFYAFYPEQRVLEEGRRSRIV